MGREEVDQTVIVQIGENVEYLNAEFEGRIKFKLNQLFMDPNHAYFPDLHADFIIRNNATIEAVIQPIEEVGAINIYLFDTYALDDGYTAMMRFTPVLRAKHNTYEFNSPRFDRLLMAYPNLIDKSTLVHVMGHFLGFTHPCDMNSITRSMIGLDDEELAKKNHTTYNNGVDDFTDEQLERMHHYAMTFRKYLLSHVEATY